MSQALDIQERSVLEWFLTENWEAFVQRCNESGLNESEAEEIIEKIKVN